MKFFYMTVLIITYSICAMDQQNISNVHPLDPHNSLTKLLYAAAVAKRGEELNEQALQQWQQLQQQAQQREDNKDTNNEIFVQNVQEVLKEAHDTATEEKK